MSNEQANSRLSSAVQIVYNMLERDGTPVRIEAAEELRHAAAELVAASASVPEGFVIAPHFRGYAHLGTCQYIVCHSGPAQPAELIIHLASEADREGRAIGEYEGIGKDVVEAEEMAVRIRFENPESLDVLENQLRMMRALHFPESAAASVGAQVAHSEPVAGEQKPIARLQEYISDRPYSEGQKFFEVAILDRSQCVDGLELYTTPVPAPATVPSLAHSIPKIVAERNAKGEVEVCMWVDGVEIHILTFKEADERISVLPTAVKRLLAAHGIAAPATVDSASPATVPELTVWEGPMPESNGKSNYTAVLTRKGASLFDPNQHTIARSEYPDRVRYEADRVRYLIGEKADRPCILDYDADKHSGYVEPTASPVVGRDAVLEEVAYALNQHMGGMSVFESAVVMGCMRVIRALKSKPASEPEAAPAAQAAAPRHEITINGHQLREALDAAWPDRDDLDQGDTELTLFLRKEAAVSNEGEPMEPGLWFYWTEYPEEGVVQLDATPAAVPQDAQQEKK